MRELYLTLPNDYPTDSFPAMARKDVPAVLDALVEAREMLRDVPHDNHCLLDPCDCPRGDIDAYFGKLEVEP